MVYFRNRSSDTFIYKHFFVKFIRIIISKYIITGHVLIPLYIENTIKVFVQCRNPSNYNTWRVSAVKLLDCLKSGWWQCMIFVLPDVLRVLCINQSLHLCLCFCVAIIISDLHDVCENLIITITSGISDGEP